MIFRVIRKYALQISIVLLLVGYFGRVFQTPTSTFFLDGLDKHIALHNKDTLTKGHTELVEINILPLLGEVDVLLIRSNNGTHWSMINANLYGLDKAAIRSLNGLSIAFNNGHLNALLPEEMKSRITQSDASELIRSILDIEYENISSKTSNELAWKSGN